MTFMCATDVTSQISVTWKALHMNKARSKSTIGCQNGGPDWTSQLLFLLAAEPSTRVQNNVRHRTNKLHTGPAAAEVRFNGYSDVDLKLSFGLSHVSKLSKPAAALAADNDYLNRPGGYRRELQLISYRRETRGEMRLGFSAECILVIPIVLWNTLIWPFEPNASLV
jgi:hypothetical protein